MGDHILSHALPDDRHVGCLLICGINWFIIIIILLRFLFSYEWNKMSWFIITFITHKVTSTWNKAISLNLSKRFTYDVSLHLQWIHYLNQTLAPVNYSLCPCVHAPPYYPSWYYTATTSFRSNKLVSRVVLDKKIYVYNQVEKRERIVHSVTFGKKNYRKIK